MSYVLLSLLIGTAVAMMLWGLQRRERVYQFPFLAGATWALYVVPQALGTVRNPLRVPQAARADGAVELALAVTAMCALAAFVGYLQKPRGRWLRRPTPRYDMDRLFLAGCGLLAVSLAGYAGLALMAGGPLAYFTTEGHYALQWSGRPVIYNFFMQFMFPALICLLYSTLRKPSLMRWCIVAVASLLPAMRGVFLGRRAHAVWFILIFALGIYFVRRWVPARWMVLGGMVVVAVAVFVAPEYRAHSQLDADRSAIGEIDVGETVGGVLSGESNYEFVNAAVIMSAFRREGAYNLGARFWNELVMNFVPTAIVPRSLKRAMFLPYTDQNALTSLYYGWTRPSYAMVTGPCDAFRELGYLCVLLYLGLGYGFRLLWHRAAVQRSVAAQLLYIGLILLTAQVVHRRVTIIGPSIVYQLLGLGPALYYARIRNPMPAGSPRRAPRRGAARAPASGGERP